MKRRHSTPFGAEMQGNGETRFALWAPAANGVDLILEDERKIPMQRGEKVSLVLRPTLVPGPVTSSVSTASRTCRTRLRATSPKTYTARARS